MGGAQGKHRGTPEGREMGWEGTDWDHVALDKHQDQNFVKTTMNFQVP